MTIYEGKNQKLDVRNRGDYMLEMEGIGYLPRDMIIEILSRLPVKTLCKFRCVSKPWLDLLTRDDEFMARHIELSKRMPSLLVRKYIFDGLGKLNNGQETTVELTTLDMNGKVTDRFSKMIDGPVTTFISCGPLSMLCCMYSLYVCNISTHQIARVPYHSKVQLHSMGFGYVPTSKEYKIVHLFYRSTNANGRMGCEIFSFKNGCGVDSGSWKTITDCPSDGRTDGYPICANGSIYWVISSGWKNMSILSLDLLKEEFSVISYPSHGSKKYSFLEFIGLEGTFCEVGCSIDESTVDIRSLKVEKDHKVWVMEYSINLFPLVPKFVIPCDDQGEEVMFYTEERDLIGYCLKSQRYKKIGDCSAMNNYNKPCLHYGSLVPLHTCSD